MSGMAQAHMCKPSETARYALFVDRQLKRNFAERDTAEREARRIRSRFPHLHVTVEDQGPAAQRP